MCTFETLKIILEFSDACDIIFKDDAILRLSRGNIKRQSESIKKIKSLIEYGANVSVNNNKALKNATNTQN